MELMFITERGERKQGLTEPFGEKGKPGGAYVRVNVFENQKCVSEQKETVDACSND